MKLYIIALLTAFLPMSSFASEALPSLNYKTARCSFLKGGKVIETRSGALMSLVIDESIGRFVQLKLEESGHRIQYQLLIEDAQSKGTGIIVLQNLAVDGVESSAEFSTSSVSWVRLAQGEYSIQCDLN
ncbi:hypothetical protein BDW_03240 [Bdellovibrio bacteriovorus W]|nr:hypothetical protein BDW_03240 [Bdellovibrio bacteriovorus W]